MRNANFCYQFRPPPTVFEWEGGREGDTFCVFAGIWLGCNGVRSCYSVWGSLASYLRGWAISLRSPLAGSSSLGSPNFHTAPHLRTFKWTRQGLLKPGASVCRAFELAHYYGYANKTQEGNSMLKAPLQSRHVSTIISCAFSSI